MIDTLKEYYENWIRIPFRDFRKGIQNLIEWFPLVWKDRDWDKHYLMEAIIFKLRKHRDYQKNYGHVAEPYNSQKVNTMTECLELLERVHNEFDYYEEPAYKKHEAKWGKSDFYAVPCEDRPDCFLLKDRNEERYTEEQIKKKNAEFILASRIAGRKRQRDFEVAMEEFVKNFDTWWD